MFLVYLARDVLKCSNAPNWQDLLKAVVAVPIPVGMDGH